MPRVQTARSRKAASRKPRNWEEDELLKNVVKYLRYTLPPHWIVHHSPNEQADELTRKIQSGKGVVPGWFDVVILGERDVGKLVPQVEPSLWKIELKVKDRVLTDSQEEMAAKLRRLRIPHGTAYSLDDVRKLVLAWGLPTRDVEILYGRVG